MPDRYFSQIAITGDEAVLSGPEAHHLIHVMRAKVGDEVILFDGGGAEFPARVVALGRHEVRLAVLGRQAIDRELHMGLILGVSLPKGDRQKWLVEKAVELGVGRLVPLVTSRSVAQPADQALVRLERAVVEASKQCGRNRLMEIGQVRAWAEFVASAPASAQRWVAHPGTGQDNAATALPDVAIGRGKTVYLAVGPEGGFTEAEIASATSAGWRTVDLGPRILRIETAALHLVSVAVTAAGRLPG